MAHRKIEEEIDRLAQLRGAPPAEALPALAKALRDRVNLVVAKAAKVAAQCQFRQLTPDLLRAYDRFFENGKETDPQCWAKHAIAQALKDLDHSEAAPFLRGLAHIQMEPSWDREVDTAEALRGTCLLALVACSDLERGEALRCFVAGLTEPAHTIRIEAARALEQMGGEEAALTLRLKAAVGDEEPEVMAQVFDALFGIEGKRALPFIATFLEKGDAGVREEAALALGSSRLPEAVERLREKWTSARDPRFREVLLRAAGLSRREEATAWLLGIAKTGRKADATDALAALALNRASDEIRRETEAAIEGRAELREPFRKLFET